MDVKNSMESITSTKQIVQVDMETSNIAAVNRGTSVCNQPQQTQIEVSFVKGLRELIPESVRAINEPTTEDVERYKKHGLFNPTIDMVQIKNVCDDRLFAYIRKLADGSREIHFVELYQDGTYSPEFTIKQSDLFEVITWQKYQDPLMERDAKRTLKKIQKEYMGKCCGSEIQNISQVIRALAEALRYLPVISDTGEMPAEHLYSEVISTIKEYCDDALKYNRREGYIILTEDDITCIAEVLSLPKRTLLAQLKKNKLLYLTNSCIGYQAKVPSYKEEGGRIIYEWSYCLLDLEYYDRKLDPARTETAKELATSFVETVNNTNF